MKIAVFKNFAIFTEKNLCWSLFLIEFIKKRLTPTEVFSCEYWEIFNNTYFDELLMNFYKGLLLQLLPYLQKKCSHIKTYLWEKSKNF